jgi:ribosomal protein S18 acetylase RimI-like enzyme
MIDASPSARVAKSMRRDGMRICIPMERAGIGDIIGECFRHDPVWRVFFPPLGRLQGTRAFFLAAVDYVMRHGWLLRTQDNGGSFLGIMDHNLFSMRGVLDLGGAEMVASLLSTTVELSDVMSLWSMAESYDLSVHGLPELHSDIYLFLFFTATGWRGRKEGSRAVRSLTKALDKDGLSCSLSTHNRRNLDMYRHLGFRLLREQENIRGDEEFFLLHP